MSNMANYNNAIYEKPSHFGLNQPLAILIIGVLIPIRESVQPVSINLLSATSHFTDLLRSFPFITFSGWRVLVYFVVPHVEEVSCL